MATIASGCDPAGVTEVVEPKRGVCDTSLFAGDASGIWEATGQDCAAKTRELTMVLTNTLELFMMQSGPTAIGQSSL